MDKPHDGATKDLARSLPEGLLVSRDWLYTHGFTRPNVDSYLRSGKLQAVTRGVYRRPGPPLKWEHVVYSLRVLGYSVHVGGRSALEMQGFAHYLNMAAWKTVDLFGVRHLPTQFLEMGDSIDLVVHGTSLFASLPDQALTTKPFGHWDWQIDYATPELALLEYLSEIEDESGFMVADKFFESATSLRPDLVTKLLEACMQVKAKRLFMWFATRHQQPWLKLVSLDGVDLGRGKRMIVRGGALDNQFQITVPKEMKLGQPADIF